MKKGVFDILKGKFLISEDALKNWKFIFFIAFLAMIMIASSHSVDKKVHEIAKLNDEVKELRSEFFDLRSKLMLLKMESKVLEKMNEKGLVASEEPPKKIKVITTK